MKIYFAGSIRGGRADAELYNEIINHLNKYGEVLTEHIGDKNIHAKGELNLTEKYIHDRDMSWLVQSDVVVAEVTTASLGVGYEIGRAVEKNKKILCLHRLDEGKLSAMILGSDALIVKKYETLDDAKIIIDKFLKNNKTNNITTNK